MCHVILILKLITDVSNVTFTRRRRCPFQRVGSPWLAFRPASARWWYEVQYPMDVFTRRGLTSARALF